MPLRSTTLKGNAALQACLVNDRAHVTPGAAGVCTSDCGLEVPAGAGIIADLRRRNPDANLRQNHHRRRPRLQEGPEHHQPYLSEPGRQHRRQDHPRTRLDEDIAKVEQSTTLFARCRRTGGGPYGLRVRCLRRAVSVGPRATTALGPGRAARSWCTCSTESNSPPAPSCSPSEFAPQARGNPAPARDDGGRAAQVWVGTAVPWPDILIHTQLPVDRFAVRKAANSTAEGEYPCRPSRSLRAVRSDRRDQGNHGRRAGSGGARTGAEVRADQHAAA